MMKNKTSFTRINFDSNGTASIFDDTFGRNSSGDLIRESTYVGTFGPKMSKLIADDIKYMRSHNDKWLTDQELGGSRNEK